MINKKYLNSFLSNEKTELVKNIGNEESEYNKIILLINYEKNIKEIVEQYEKLISFSEILFKNILDENENLRKSIAIKTVIDDKLFITWDKSIKKFDIDYSKSSTLLSDDKYLNPVLEFLDLMKNKLAKRINSYQISLDNINLKDWGDF